MKNKVLVIDQGTHSTRAVIHDQYGIIQSASVPIAINVNAHGWIEQDAEEIYQSVRAALDALMHKSTLENIQHITSAALIVQRSSFVACEKSSGKPITPVISWQDTRNQRFINQLYSQWSNIQAITGLRPNAHYGASKMRWLLDNEPALKKAYAENNLIFLPLAAYLSKKLTQSVSYVVDGAIAARTLLVDVNNNVWSDELLTLFAIDKDCLPQIVPNDYSFGDIVINHLTVPLQLVGGDQSYIAFAAGLPIQENTAYINIGSGAFVQMLDANFMVDDGLLKSVLTIEKNQSIKVLEGTVNAAATALDWLWHEQGKSLTIDDISKALGRINNISVFINKVAGVGSPHWLPAQASIFLGDACLEGKAIAVLESIVFALQDNLCRFKVYNKMLDCVVIGGGLSQFSGLCQKLANLTQLPIMQLKTHEVSVQGVAYYILNVQYDQRQIVKVYQPQKDEALALRYSVYQQHLSTP